MSDPTTTRALFDDPMGDERLAAQLPARRHFLVGGAAATAAALMPLHAIGASATPIRRLEFSPDYGPLAPVNDEATGYPLLQLPQGFRYSSFGWSGDVMEDGVPTPSAHDGMAVCAVDRTRLVLVRNHEQGGASGSFGSSLVTFDARADGGTTNLTFNDLRHDTQLRRRPHALGLVAHLRGNERGPAHGDRRPEPVHATARLGFRGTVIRRGAGRADRGPGRFLA
jgi:secreted PhoX family phosphatase